MCTFQLHSSLIGLKKWILSNRDVRKLYWVIHLQLGEILGFLIDFICFWYWNYFFYSVRLLCVYIDFSGVVTYDLAPSRQGRPAGACADPSKGAIISGRSMVDNAHGYCTGSWEPGPGPYCTPFVREIVDAGSKTSRPRQVPCVRAKWSMRRQKRL